MTPRRAFLALAFVLGFGTLVHAALPGAEPDLLTISTDPLLAKTLYQHPDRLISGVAPSGAANVNAQWEKKEGAEWFIEQQRGGADLVQAGVVLKDQALIRQGILVINWGFAQQGPNGDFPGTGDPLHSTSFFVEAAARSALLLKQARFPAFDAQVKEWTPKVQKAAQWMSKPEVEAKGRDKNLEPYTHRYYLRAAALGMAASLTGDKALADAALKYAREALTKQQPDGTNPEKGGFDVSYQVVGATFALRYLTVCPDPAVRDSIKKMAAKSIDGATAKINPDGTLSTEGSTRTGQEESRSGKTKTLDYKMILQGLIFAEKILKQRKYGEAADKLAKGRRWAVVELPRENYLAAQIAKLSP